MSHEPLKCRIDKWLWAIRLFKSRTDASNACKSGKVKRDGKALKPAQLIGAGETITVRKNQRLFVLKVVQIIDKRVNAEKAKQCYEDITPPSEIPERLPSAFYGSNPFKRPKGSGRPTKKERRNLDRLRGEWDW